jgi:ubiquinone/menaquinone biosynthesis C-methylase UbiE
VKRLTDAKELLDGPLSDERALMDNLRDLRRINRWIGGVTLSRTAIDRLAGRTSVLTLLDVGTGGADIPLALLRSARARGDRLSIVGLDSRPEVLAAAVHADPAVLDTDGLQLRSGDGTALPFPDGAFDIAHCSLVLHHLDSGQAMALLTEMARVSRLGVVVNDLDRTWLGWVGAWLLGHFLTRNRYTRHDAPLSVRRAYQADEVGDLLRAAGLRPVHLVRRALGQRYAIAARSASET